MKRVLMIWVWAVMALVACAAPATEPPANPDTSVEVNEAEAVAPGQERVVEEAAVADETTATDGEVASSIQAAEQSGEEAVVASEPALGSSVLLTIFEGRHLLRPADPFTGQDLKGYAPIDLGIEMAWPAFSPDGKTVATISNGSQLHLTDLASWQDTTTELRFPNTIASAFSPDGMRLAVAYSNRHSGTSVALVDIDEQSIVAEAFVELWPRWRELHFTPDGSAIVLYGQSSSSSGNAGEDAGPARVVLLSSSDLAVEWDMVLADVVDGVRCEAVNCDNEGEQRTHWQPAVVLSPDSRSLYIVHADEDKLTTVGLDTRTVETRPVQPALSWLDRLMALTAGVAQAKEFDQVSKQGVISPDGSRLYIVGWRVDVTMDDQGRPEMVEAPLGLQVIATDSGMEIAAAESGGWWLAQSPDGKQLYVHGGQGDDVWTDVLDAASLEVIARVDGFRVAPGQRLDGQPILLASSYSGQNNTSLAVVDAESLQIRQRRTIHNYAEWVTR